MEKSKCVIYARFSSDKQREESIDGQIRECTAYAESQNLEIIGTYIDRAMSARSDNRPGLVVSRFFRKFISSASKYRHQIYGFSSSAGCSISILNRCSMSM